MQTSTSTNENFSQTLRGISQRRKQGILEVTLPTTKATIFFVQGRIVETVLNDENPVVTVCDRLVAAGRCSMPNDPNWQDSYQALWNAIKNDGPPGRPLEFALFKKIIQHRVFDALYVLNTTNPGVFHFQSQMVEHDKECAPSISVGQLLLDFVALEGDAAAFFQKFPKDKGIRRKGSAESGQLTEEEVLLLEELSVPLIFEDLKLRSMLSTYTMREALLRLQSVGLIEVCDLPKGIASGGVFSDAFLENLESSIDSAFGGQAGTGGKKRPTPSDSGDDFDLTIHLEGESRASTVESVTTPEPKVTRASAAVEVSEQVVEKPAEPLFDIKRRLAALSYPLLTANIVPATIVVALLFGAILIPYLRWGPVLHYFAH
jgi:hypothetical protein